MRWTNWGYCVVLLALNSVAQSPPTPAQTIALEVTAADRNAGRQPRQAPPHTLPMAAHRQNRETLADIGRAAIANAAVPNHHAVTYIGTLTNQGGPVMDHAVEHAIYLIPSNGACPSVASCWGHPEQFLFDLGRSEFIHITDQYVGTAANVRYTVGVSGRLNYTIPANPLVDSDIAAIVHAMVVKDGGLNGYHHEYHVFLPPGQDECFDSTFSVCASNSFCAYHSSADFTDVGHVIYSVEPWAGAPGCTGLQPDGTTPSTQYSILSHETIESITDPDGDAWWNASGNLDLYGFEIADECQWIFFGPTSVGFLMDQVYLNGRPYFVQSEYNNHANGCTDGPGPGGD